MIFLADDFTTPEPTRLYADRNGKLYRLPLANALTPAEQWRIEQDNRLPIGTSDPRD